jgi:tRNA pseudouridine55 synthase
MDGIILIDKPAGPTSAEVVRGVKRSLGKRCRVGHLGTLDPFATGVLPILIGEGTKLAPFLQHDRKEYRGIIALGVATDTLDRTGITVSTAQVPPFDARRLSAVAQQFIGVVKQTPPIFSAIKRGGVPLYRLARRCREVEPPSPREVEITRLELEPRGADSIQFDITCSPGTYVRSLARDIGAALGTVAHLHELRRLRSGSFSIDDAVALDVFIAALETDANPGLIDLRAALPGLAEIEIDASTESRLRNGDSRALDGLVPASAGRFKVVASGKLVAVAESTSRVTATIARIFNAAG